MPGMKSLLDMRLWRKEFSFRKTETIRCLEMTTLWKWTIKPEPVNDHSFEMNSSMFASKGRLKRWRNRCFVLLTLFGDIPSRPAVSRVDK